MAKCKHHEFEFNVFMNQYGLLCRNRFKWENLPNGLESRHIEKGIYEHGQVLFYDDDTLGLICLPCSETGERNVYGDSLSFNVTGQGFSKQVKKGEGVRIFDNDNFIPPIYIINHYANLISNTEKTIKSNLKQQRYPYIIPTTKDNEFSMKQFYKKLDNGEEAIFIDNKFSAGGDCSVKVLQTNAPYLLDKLVEYKKEVEIELLTILGLNNTNTNKKERLLVDEVNVNNSHILMNLDIGYELRQKACEKINEIYGLDVKVIKTIEVLEENFSHIQNEEPKEKSTLNFSNFIKREVK